MFYFFLYIITYDDIHCIYNPTDIHILTLSFVHEYGFQFFVGCIRIDISVVVSFFFRSLSHTIHQVYIIIVVATVAVATTNSASDDAAPIDDDDADSSADAAVTAVSPSAEAGTTTSASSSDHVPVLVPL